MNMVKANKLGRLTVTVTFKVLINLEYLGGEGEQRLGREDGRRDRVRRRQWRRVRRLIGDV